MSAAVPVPTRVAYASAAFALALVGIPIYVYVPKFYTDVVGVPIASVGTLLIAVRLFDALTDPVIGVLSDRTRTRFGRRRPYILLGALPLAAALYALLVPPELEPATATLWFGAFFTALFLCWTLVTVPYESLGPEITNDHHARTSLLGARDGALAAGTVAAVASPTLIAWALDLQPTATGERARFFWIAVLYAPLLVGLCAWSALGVPERPARAQGAASRTPAWSHLAEFRTLLDNRPFAILLASYTVSALGSNLPATLILYYVEYVLGAPDAGVFLLLYLGTGIAFLPMWVVLSRRWGKKRAWLTGMAINTLAFTGVFLLGQGQLLEYGGLVVLSGVGFGATLAVPSSMQADVIDYDELLSGERREGRYLGVWSISRKLAAALGVGVALPLLGWVGYVPNQPQPADVQLALRVMYALVPSACNALAFVIALRYPIDQALHGEILDAIDRRDRGAASVHDPLRREPLRSSA